MWVFNVFLYLCFLFNQDFYRQLVERQGAECYFYVAEWGDQDPDARPVCFYLQN